MEKIPRIKVEITHTDLYVCMDWEECSKADYCEHGCTNSMSCKYNVVRRNLLDEYVLPCPYHIKPSAVLIKYKPKED